MENNSSSKSSIFILISLAAACLVVFLVDFLFMLESFDKHAVFEWENWPGFYGVFGFISCVVIVVIARYGLRPLVKRGEDVYE